MSDKFNPKDFEQKWQEMWKEKEVYATPKNPDKENNAYILDMYPYPSGSGLHVGHPRGYLGADIVARYARMQGKSVLHPMGFDSFGLPAENYAIKTGTPPEESTNKAIKYFKEQIAGLGMSYDWSREVTSHDPDYMRWTQWLFLKMYEKGVAYQKEAPVNWCPTDQTVLANEQVEPDGTCERCGSEVIQKNLKQWFFKITDYAERLIEDLEKIDWPQSTKLGQINWIGKKTGININYEIDGHKDISITCFTTRPDTNFGATFIVLAPDGKALEEIIEISPNREEILKYKKDTENKTELERQKEGRNKTGVFTGLYAINNLNGKKIPVYVSDFVLAGFGTGAVVGVPAHDRRDFEFAQLFNIEVIPVVKNEGLKTFRSYLMGNENIKKEDLEKIGVRIVDETEKGVFKVEIPNESYDEYKKLIADKLDKGFWNEVIGDEIWFLFKEKDGSIKEYIFDWNENREEIAKKCSEFNKDDIEKTINLYLYLASNEFYTDLMIQEEDGIMINSDFLNGMNIHEATEKVMDYLEEKGWGKRVTTYRLRDWLISRQRYWGCPIPIVYDPEGVPHAVRDEHLPLRLPTDVDYQPKGKSPVASSESYVKLAEELYGEGWRFETDTLDTFMDSSWYFFRFTDPRNVNEFAASEKMNTWLPVDLYVGGAEHTVLHLMYARFFTKFLYDEGYIDFDEPFMKLRHQGTVLAEDSRKMSKRWGNTIDPNTEIQKYGADTLRIYEMFMGPFDGTLPWNTETEVGVHRFLQKVWGLRDKVATSPQPSPQGEGVDAQEREINKLIKKVGDDIDAMSFNTSVAKMMEFVNFLQKEESISRSVWERFILVLAPFGPFIAEELWAQLGNEFSVHQQSWPAYDESLIVDDVVEIGVQVNGKMRGTISIAPDASESDAMKAAIEVENIAKHIGDGEPKKVIYVAGRILNVIV